MPPRLVSSNDYELVERASSESNNAFDLDDANFESQGLTSSSYVHLQKSRFSQFFLRFVPSHLQAIVKRIAAHHRRRRVPTFYVPGRWRPVARCLFSIFWITFGVVLSLLVLTAVSRPSYTKEPTHYQLLRRKIQQSSQDGRGNPDKQKIFIATTVYDKEGCLVKGDWGNSIINLIEILGSDNVFLSIYQNGKGEEARHALKAYEHRVPCRHEFVFEDHMSLDNLPRITLPDGSQRVKRISYLAEARNRALRPLNQVPATKYDKLMFLNDVFFDPLDAIQLLLSTHVDEKGKTDYLAACAVDFINPLKFYDTFATRDAEGFSMGVPFFPWFSNAGKGVSRQDVLDGRDAVRVKSCWGGMVAFDAKLFQATKAHNNQNPASVENKQAPNASDGFASSLPLRFRAEPDLYWDASECCLIHADLQSYDSSTKADDDHGIYQNPFVRVAYDARTLWWLGCARRFERLWAWPQHLINRLVGLPWFNPRRTEQVRSKVADKVWIPDPSLEGGGSFQDVDRLSTTGGFCGMRTLQVIKERTRNGEKNWETIPVPQS